MSETRSHLRGFAAGLGGAVVWVDVGAAEALAAAAAGAVGAAGVNPGAAAAWVSRGVGAGVGREAAVDSMGITREDPVFPRRA